MNYSKNYFFYMLVYVSIFSFFDFYTNKFYSRIWKKKTFNEKIKLIFYLIVHNLIFYIIFFTFLFILYYYKQINWKESFAYLLVTILIPLHWVTNNNQCAVTVEQNKLLEIPEDYGFRDFYTILTDTYPKASDKSKVRDKLYYGYLITAMISTLIITIIKFRK